MSAYISHLILQVEKQKETMSLLNSILSKMPQIDLETLAMIKEQGVDKQ
jgi:hypothetical protein